MSALALFVAICQLHMRTLDDWPKLKLTQSQRCTAWKSDWLNY